MGLFGGKWIAIRSASGARADDMDRLYAILKSSGLKAKISEGAGKLKTVSVKAKDEEAAKVLVEQFEKER